MREVKTISKLPYGYIHCDKGIITVDAAEAAAVKLIYENYLSGQSLGTIATTLYDIQVPSPSGKQKWTPATLNKLLSNQKYVPHVICMEDFLSVQLEKGQRSNINIDTDKRKATRYNSQNVLSGLLVCAECGRNYRRYTRGSGEVVWRCANRVELGNKICKHSPSISEAVIIDYLCDLLDMKEYKPENIRSKLETLVVSFDKSLVPQLVEEPSLRNQMFFG